MKRLWVALALVFVAAAPAAARKYVNEIALTTASEDSTIFYFDEAAQGSTATYADREEVDNWSISHQGSGTVTIRIYTKAAPAYASPFSEALGSDYISFSLAFGESRNFDDGSVPFIGYAIITGPASGSVKLLGWDR